MSFPIVWLFNFDDETAQSPTEHKNMEFIRIEKISKYENKIITLESRYKNFRENRKFKNYGSNHIHKL